MISVSAMVEPARLPRAILPHLLPCCKLHIAGCKSQHTPSPLLGEGLGGGRAFATSHPHPTRLTSASSVESSSSKSGPPPIKGQGKSRINGCAHQSSASSESSISSASTSSALTTV